MQRDSCGELLARRSTVAEACARDTMLAPEQGWAGSDKPAPVVHSAAGERKQGRPAARVVSLHAHAGPPAGPPAPPLPVSQRAPATSVRPAAGLVSEPSCRCPGRTVAPGAPAAEREAAEHPASSAPAPAESGSSGDSEAALRVFALSDPAAFPVAGSVEGSGASGASLSSSGSDASGADAKPAQRTRDIWGGAVARPELNLSPLPAELREKVLLYGNPSMESGVYLACAHNTRPGAWLNECS